jgi:hypothetical protein
MYEAQAIASGPYPGLPYLCLHQATISAMQQSELNPTQARDWQLFNLILEGYGWDDPEHTEWRMEHGEVCTPEGHRTLSQNGVCLEARYHAPVNMISLRVSEPNSQENIQLHFLYDNRPERILEWMVQQQAGMDLESYQDLLKSAQKQCEMILLEKSDMEIYEVKPSA